MNSNIHPGQRPADTTTDAAAGAVQSTSPGVVIANTGAAPTSARGTGFGSVAVQRCPRADHIDLYAVPIADGAPSDPAWWARRTFSPAGLPRWVAGLLTLRQALVPLLGLKPSPKDILAVREVVGDEALITASERHLDFWCAVGVDGPGVQGTRLLRITTVVQLHGWRGRVYWGLVRYLHGPVTLAMMRRVTSDASRQAVPA